MSGHESWRRLPGPTDWAYQGVVKLRPEDARRLAEQHKFVPFASIDPDVLTRAQLRAALAVHGELLTIPSIIADVEGCRPHLARHPIDQG